MNIKLYLVVITLLLSSCKDSGDGGFVPENNDDPIEINKIAKWKTAIPISSESDNIGILKEAIRLSIGGGEFGNTHVVWNEYSGGTWHIMQNIYDSEAAWDSPSHLDLESADAALPLLSVNEQGDSVVVWKESENTWTKRFSHSSGWGGAELIGDSGPGRGVLSIDKFGEILWIYRQWNESSGSFSLHAKKFALESGWEVTERIDDKDQGSVSSLSMAITPRGDAIVVWSQYDGEILNLSTRSNIWANFYSKTTGWEKAELIENQNDGNAVEVQAAIDDSGNAVVSWTQFDGLSSLPQTTRSSIYVNLFQASSRWSGAVKISQRDDLNAISSSLSLNENGNGIVVWSEYPWNGVVPASINAKEIVKNSLSSEVYEISQGDLWGDYSPGMKKGATPKVVTDIAGKSIVVWRGVGSIFSVTHYPDEGWQSPELIATGGFILYQPKISIDSRGRAIATWVQQNNNFINPVSYRIWANRME